MEQQVKAHRVRAAWSVPSAVLGWAGLVAQNTPYSQSSTPVTS